jgi:uridine kinase
MEKEITLRVLVIPDGDAWYGQGVEIDYAAQGRDHQELLKNFTEGLTATIKQNVKNFGDFADRPLASADAMTYLREATELWTLKVNIPESV